MRTRARATKHQAFGEKIYELREQAQLTQNQLAAKASLSRSALSRILNGVREVRTRHVLQLARALGLTPAALVEGTDCEGVVGNWVPRAQYDRSERDRIRANDAFVAERARSAVFAAEMDALRLDLKRVRGELGAAQTQVAILTASERVFSTMVHDLRAELAVMRRSRDKFERALKDARRRTDRS